MFSQSASGLWAPTANFQTYEKNTLQVYNPQPNMKISPQALRGHNYNFDDRLINNIARTSSSIANGGVTTDVNTLANSKEARNAITMGMDVDGVFDVNRYNSLWKFVLTLNHFPDVPGVTKYTVILTGVFYDEPFNPVTRTVNERAQMKIHSKQVIQNSGAAGAGGFHNGAIHTSSDQLFFTPHEAQQSNLLQSQLGKNTPGAFDLSNPTITDGAKPVFSTPSLYNVNEQANFSQAPITLNRFSSVPDTIIRNVLEATSNNIATSQANSFGSALGAVLDVPDAHFPEQQLPGISEILKQREDNVHLPLGLGPNENDVVTVGDLKTKWLVTEMEPIELQDGTSFAGEDQTARSQKAMWCSLLSSVLPSYCSNSQIADAQFHVWVSRGDFGAWDFAIEWQHVGMALALMNNQRDVQRACQNLFTRLKAAVFTQMFETTGDFDLRVDYHHYGKSHLALSLPNESMSNNGGVWEFTPNHSTFTIPMIATTDHISSNQNNFGNMLLEVTKRSGSPELVTPNEFNTPSIGPAFSFDSGQASGGMFDSQITQNSSPSQPFNPFGGSQIDDRTGQVHNPNQGNHNTGWFQP